MKNSTKLHVFLHLGRDRKLFRQKRAVQLEAVRSMSSLDKYEKQYKMAQMLLQQMFKVRECLGRQDQYHTVGLCVFSRSTGCHVQCVRYSMLGTLFMGLLVIQLPTITMWDCSRINNGPFDLSISISMSRGRIPKTKSRFHRHLNAPIL